MHFVASVCVCVCACVCLCVRACVCVCVSPPFSPTRETHRERVLQRWWDVCAHAIELVGGHGAHVAAPAQALHTRKPIKARNLGTATKGEKGEGNIDPSDTRGLLRKPRGSLGRRIIFC